jgi:hypothetical protein
MRKLLVAALVLVATPAFAIDGQVLINLSTINAQGGFPYRITQPGSYKLTGNLSVLNQSAILIAANHVSIDLNGYTIQCATDENLAFSSWGCIWDGFVRFHDVTVRNGSIVVNTTGVPGFMIVAGVRLLSTSQVIVQDMHLEMNIPGSIVGFSSSTGPESLIQNNLTSGSGGAFEFACPSLVVQNINSLAGIGSASGAGCVYVNNIGVPILAPAP